MAAVSSGGALSVLAASLYAWLSQPRRSDVRIRVQGDTGRAVEIDARPGGRAASRGSAAPGARFRAA